MDGHCLIGEVSEVTQEGINVARYRDADGHEWSVEITGYEMRELSRAGVPVGMERGLRELFIDAGYLAEVLYVICKEDADDKKLNRKEFMKGIRDTAIKPAREAFFESYINFSPPAEKKMIQILIDETTREMSETIESVVRDQEKKISGKSSTSLPESPE